MKQGAEQSIRPETPVDSDQRCTCDPDDFGMGHGLGCPAGERQRRKSIAEMCDRLAAFGVPEQALTPLRGWLKILEAAARTLHGETQRTADDCLRCAVATLLDMPYEAVPHFVELAGQDCWLALLWWCQWRGLEFEWQYDDPGVRCIAKGASPRGKGKTHAVV